MYAPDQANLAKYLQELERDWAEFPRFLSSFDRRWVANGRISFWTVANQTAIQTNMETNNFVESWHNQLKTLYLDRRPNRRVDRLLYLLVNDVATDYQANIQRVTARMGRMGPMEYEERKRVLMAEAVPSECVTSMVTANVADDDSIVNFSVASLTTEDIHYDITVRENRMVSCDCISFNLYGGFARKHMHLCQRVYPEISIPRTG